ncbi:MAG: hypothetical protein NVS1B12_13470 [Acidimicrobiales bacterium]
MLTLRDAAPDPVPAKTPHARAEGRDRTLDAMRGIFIISMTAGHLAGGDALDRWSHPLVWVDGAAGFVLFSGLVLGMQQKRLHRRHGDGAGRRWLVRRALVIWAVHVVLTMTALAMRTITGSPTFLPSMSSFGGLLPSLAGVLLLRIQPDFCNVLPLYVVLLLAAVGVVALLRRGHTALCVGLSIALYAAAQADPHVVFIADLSVGTSTWGWGAWQLLFVLGMATGWHWTTVRDMAHRVKRPLVASCAASVGVLAVSANLIVDRDWPGSTTWVPTWFGKYELRPGVVLYLGAAVVVTYVVMEHIGHRRGFRLVVDFLSRIGTRSLDCFIMLSLVQLAVFAGAETGRSALADIALVAGSAAGFWVLASVRGGHWRSAVVTPRQASRHEAALLLVAA